MSEYKNKNIKFEEIESAVNNGVSSTLTRSINTTITTILPIIMFIIMGAREIYEFDIAILIGLIAGAYSSIFLSSELWSYLEYKSMHKQKNNKNDKKKTKKTKPEELMVKGINS